MNAMDKMKIRARSGGWGHNFQLRLDLIVMTLEQKLEEVKGSHEEIWGKNVPERESRPWKCLLKGQPVSKCFTISSIFVRHLTGWEVRALSFT